MKSNFHADILDQIIAGVILSETIHPPMIDLELKSMDIIDEISEETISTPTLILNEPSDAIHELENVASYTQTLKRNYP
jgi:hypothetical protein